MCYANTFITISEDSTVISAIIPTPKHNKPTIASIEYDLIYRNPYEYTQEDVQFLTYLIKNQMEMNNLEEKRNEFFSKSKACFRASPLVKNYGWGIHYNEAGKVAIYEKGSEHYKQLENSSQLKILKGMRTKKTVRVD